MASSCKFDNFPSDRMDAGIAKLYVTSGGATADNVEFSTTGSSIRESKKKELEREIDGEKQSDQRWGYMHATMTMTHKLEFQLL